jgi:hypothetical protein
MRADAEKLRRISYLHDDRRRLGGFLTVVEMVPARARRKTRTRNSVVPAKAGTQFFRQRLDSGLRRNDETGRRR